MTRVEHLADGVTLYCGDMVEVLPTLPHFDLCLTDPPYGIGRDGGMGGGGAGLSGKRYSNKYDGGWDKSRPSLAAFNLILKCAEAHIIWGGNYFADLLPMSQKWLWWDKQQTMPSYSDGELAWTSLSGTSTKKFVYNGNGMLGKEKGREHPTQKPEQLMKWCIGLAPATTNKIIDPYCGSGSSGVAAIKLGKRFIGIEVDPLYFDLSCRRISDALKEPDLFVEASIPSKQEAFI